MTIYGTQEQCKLIPGLYRDISYLPQDLEITSNNRTRDKKEETKGLLSATNEELRERILRNSMDL